MINKKIETKPSVEGSSTNENEAAALDRTKVFSERLDAFYRTDELKLQGLPKGIQVADVVSSKQHELVGKYTLARDLAFSDSEQAGLIAPAIVEEGDGKVYVVKQILNKKITDNNRRHNVPSEFADVEDYLDRRRFLHQNVLTPLDRVQGEDDSARVYEAGLGNLEDYLDAKKVMEPSQALSVMIRLGDGLAALHKKGVAHTDVAPLNIILFPKTAKIGDLDAASIDVTGQGKFNRAENKLWGNRFILPPEMFEDSPNFDTTVDTYQAAATLYRMVAGKWPYDAEEHTMGLPFATRMEAYRKMHKSGKIEFPDSIPESIQNVIRKAMDPSPSNRPSMREFTTTLLDIKEKELPNAEQQEFLVRSRKKTVVELEASLERRRHILRRLKKTEKKTVDVEQEIATLTKLLLENRDRPSQEFGPGVFVFRQRELTKDSKPSEVLKVNKNAKLDFYKEIRTYLDAQDPQYLEQLSILESQISEPMERDTEVVACIPIAGHQEFDTIYSTLASYAKQNADPKTFEVLLLVNFPQRLMQERADDVKKTLEEIERAKRDFPKLRLRIATTVLPDDQVKIGNIRKICTDLALLRQRRSKNTHDLVLLSNDADNEGLSENYVNNFASYFKDNPEKEGAVGNLQFSADGFVRFPAIHVRTEFSTCLDQQGFKNGNVDLFGNNSAMKSSIYAGIGGYPTILKTGEQEWTGNTIRKLRKSKSTLGFAKDALLVTSIRRPLISHLTNGGEGVAFGNETAEAQMRALDVGSYPMFDYSDDVAVAKLKVELEESVDRTIKAYEKGDLLGKNAFFYKNNLRKVGIEYRVDGDPKSVDSKVVITDMGRFIARQKIMQRVIKAGEHDMAKVYEASLVV